MIQAILAFFDVAPGAQLIRGSSWLYTFFLMWHFTGLSLLIGGLLVIDLRVLGFAKRMPLDLPMKFLPFVILGFVINAFTGYFFWVFQPYALAVNWAFKIKMILVLLAGLNALFFTLFEEKKLKALAASGAEPDMGMKISAGASLIVWFLVIVWGRMIVAFQGSDSLFGN